MIARRLALGLLVVAGGVFVSSCVKATPSSAVSSTAPTTTATTTAQPPTTITTTTTSPVKWTTTTNAAELTRLECLDKPGHQWEYGVCLKSTPGDNKGALHRDRRPVVRRNLPSRVLSDSAADNGAVVPGQYAGAVPRRRQPVALGHPGLCERFFGGRLVRRGHWSAARPLGDGEVAWRTCVRCPPSVSDLSPEEIERLRRSVAMLPAGSQVSLKREVVLRVLAQLLWVVRELRRRGSGSFGAD